MEHDDDGGGTLFIDRPILEFLRDRVASTTQVERAEIDDPEGHIELRVDLASRYYPRSVEEVLLTVRWYTTDDFKIHYREARADDDWECRWDRHPNQHDTRDHFHPPPEAETPGEDADWPSDHRDVLSLVLDEIEDRVADLWEQ